MNFIYYVGMKLISILLFLIIYIFFSFNWLHNFEELKFFSEMQIGNSDVLSNDHMRRSCSLPQLHTAAISNKEHR